MTSFCLRAQLFMETEEVTPTENTMSTQTELTFWDHFVLLVKYVKKTFKHGMIHELWKYSAVLLSTYFICVYIVDVLCSKIHGKYPSLSIINYTNCGAT